MRKKIDLRLVAKTIQQREVNETLTFRELANAWLAVTQNGTDLLRLKKWLDAYGDRIAWELTTDELTGAALGMVEHGYAPSSANRDIGAIGSMYKWVIGERRAPAGFVSPTINIRRFAEATRRVFLEDAQLERLRSISLTYKDKRFPVFVHLLIDTGARKSELLERTWDDFDLEQCQIILHTSKTEAPRVLHFTEATAAMIRRFIPSRPKGELVFPGRTKAAPINYRTAWESLTKDAGCEGLHQHDIRHDRARRLLVAGVSLPVAASIMGHSAQVLEKRYGHLATADHKRAVEAAWQVAA